MSVFEVVHLGVDPAAPVVKSRDLPPLLRMPCCKPPCLRCEKTFRWDLDPSCHSVSQQTIARRDLGACAIRPWHLGPSGSPHATPAADRIGAGGRMAGRTGRMPDRAPYHLMRPWDVSCAFGTMNGAPQRSRFTVHSCSASPWP